MLYSNRTIVSVIMSVYNGEKYLSKAIDSILIQTFTNFEFIIIEDGSTDKSLEIINSYSEKDKRIKLVINRDNLGLAKSINKGLALAKGEYIARMDADDISDPNRFLAQVQFLEKNKSIDIVGCWVEIINHDSQSTGKIWKFLHSPMSLRWITFFTVPVMHPSVMLRRKIFDLGNRYEQSENFAQDYGLWIRLNSDFRFSNIQVALLKYRIHSDSISGSKYIPQHEAAYLMSKKAIDSYLGNKYPLDLIKLINTPYHVQSVDQLKSSADLLQQMYQKFRQENTLEPIDFININLDLANRFIKLSINNWQYFYSWLLFVSGVSRMVRTHIFDLAKHKRSAVYRKLRTISDALHYLLR
jgi:glycosyltransferase involved in cell wall biosynthesis